MEQLLFSGLLRLKYRDKVHLLPLDAGMGCPNRDGTIGEKGCLVCPSLSMGSFSEGYYSDLASQLEWAKERVSSEEPGGKYIACFSGFCNTYSSVENLRFFYREAIEPEDVVGLYITTRPDCLNDGIIKLLTEISAKKSVWIELKLHTAHDGTAEYLGRNFKTTVFDETVRKLKSAGIKTFANMIIGLPEETEEDILATAMHISELGVDGVRFEPLCVFSGTELEKDLTEGKIKLLTLDEYGDIVYKCVSSMRNSTIIHRLIGKVHPHRLIGPEWTADPDTAESFLYQKLNIK